MGSAIRILNSDAEHIRIQAGIEAKRVVQAARNENQGAQAALANFTRALSNKRAMEAGGKEMNAIAENIGRNLDYATTGRLQRRVQAAEELGMLAANAAAAGVGGSTIDMFSQQVMATEDRVDEQTHRALNSDLYLATESRADVLRNTVAGFDTSQTFANLDFTKHVDHKKLSGLAKYFAFQTAAVATYFGGPQAGGAVLDATMAIQDGRNGDFNGMAAGFNNAFVGAVNGAKTYTGLATKDNPGGEAWGKGMWASARNMLGNIRLG